MISTNELLGLEGKTIVITGAAGIICSGLAEGFCQVGMNVMLLDFNVEGAVNLANDLSKKFPKQIIKGIFVNVLEEQALIGAKAEILKYVSKIDYLLNGAGGNNPKGTTDVEQIIPGENEGTTFFDLQWEGFNRVFDLNLKGTLLPTQVFAKEMIARKDGAILNISSMNAFRPLTKIPAYSAAKSSINNFTEWLAVHFAKSGVRVNAIAPGFFLTDQNRFLLINKETGEMTPRAQKIVNNTPMGRYGEIDELIGTSIYLMSDMAKFVTGIVIPIDGGFSAYSGV
jgi:NAD(P)-dependent dehydrogenase (short-subunit alcohol dehydrogenase family)